MKKHIPFVVAVLLMCHLVFLPSCFPADPIVGSLTVKVLDFYTGLPVISEKVYIATSYTNMQQGNYYAVTMTDLNGNAFFGEIPPLVYYYDTETWQDWGAIQTYAGIDQYAYLYVNDPIKKTAD